MALLKKEKDTWNSENKTLNDEKESLQKQNLDLKGFFLKNS